MNPIIDGVFNGTYTVTVTIEHDNYSLTKSVQLKTNEKSISSSLFDQAVNKVYHQIKHDKTTPTQSLQLHLTRDDGEELVISDKYELPDDMGTVWLKKMISRIEIKRLANIEKVSLEHELPVNEWAQNRFEKNKLTIRAANRLRHHYHNKTIRELLRDIDSGTFQNLRGIGRVTVDEIIAAIREDFFGKD